MERKVILIVEDNKDEMVIYSTLLSHKGYAILAAANFEAAVEIARDRSPDLAIVDVNLGDPTRDGCDLVGVLRQTENTRNMPIIAHTAFGDIYRVSLENAGCQGIVHKPSNPQQLLETIERLIGPPEVVAQ